MFRTGFRGGFSAAVVSGIFAVAAGCASVEMTKIAAKAQEPANVALFVDVHDGSGDGIKGLNEKSFKLYEDGKLMPANKARRALLPSRAAGTKYTLLLVDLSGPIASSPAELAGVARTIGHFVSQLADKQEVAVSVFDGNEEVAPFLGFGAGTEQVPGLVDGLRKFKPRDPNTNWNGAIFQGLYALDEQLAASTFAQKSAALVIFTDRATDLAQHVGIDAMKRKVQSSPAEIYVIGVGSNINKAEVNDVGKSGTFVSTDPHAYQKGFDEIEHKLASSAEGRYFFSYCSPKRKGQHTVELEVLAPSGKVARVSYRFNADGFTGGCSPRKAPSLYEAPPPPPKKEEAEASDDDTDDNASSSSEAAPHAKTEAPAAPPTDSAPPDKEEPSDKN